MRLSGVTSVGAVVLAAVAMAVTPTTRVHAQADAHGAHAVEAADAADVTRYVIDTSHSHVGFTVRHLAVTNVRGKFTRFAGEILLNETDITRSVVKVTIEANSIDTSHERRDNHLRSNDFLAGETYPQITFTSTRIDRTDSGLVMIGNLTIRDVTKEVAVPFELVGPVTTESGRKRLGAEGTLRLNRFDYGLEWNRLQEAVQVAGDEVRIELNIEANTPRQG